MCEGYDLVAVRLGQIVSSSRTFSKLHPGNFILLVSSIGPYCRPYIGPVDL